MHHALNKFRFVILLMSFLLWGACFDQASPNRIEEKWTGRIDAFFLSHVISSAESGSEALLLSSRGGDPRIAIEAAKIIQSNGIILKVDGICLSACAMLVYLVDDVQLSENSVVLFHGSSSGMLLLHSIHSEKPENLNVSNIVNAADRDHDAFKLFGRSPEIDKIARLSMVPICISEYIQGSDSKVKSVISRNLYRWWLPTRAEFEKLRGAPIEGFWPSSQEDYHRLSAFHGENLPSSVKVGMETLSVEEIDNVIERAQLQNCSTIDSTTK